MPPRLAGGAPAASQQQPSRPSASSSTAPGRVGRTVDAAGHLDAAGRRRGSPGRVRPAGLIAAIPEAGRRGDVEASRPPSASRPSGSRGSPARHRKGSTGLIGSWSTSPAGTKTTQRRASPCRARADARPASGPRRGDDQPATHCPAASSRGPRSARRRRPHASGTEQRAGPGAEAGGGARRRRTAPSTNRPVPSRRRAAPTPIDPRGQDTASTSPAIEAGQPTAAQPTATPAGPIAASAGGGPGGHHAGHPTAHSPTAADQRARSAVEAPFERRPTVIGSTSQPSRRATRAGADSRRPSRRPRRRGRPSRCRGRTGPWRTQP